MIGGNIEGIIQTKGEEGTVNAIGEIEKEWENTLTLTGFLDLSGGSSKYTSYNAKIQESTHIFICDYISSISSIKAENARMIVNNELYDIMLIDNPMNLNRQLEIYLKYTGGLNG